MASAQPSATASADSIDLVDENKAWSMFFPLVEQVSNPGCTNTYEHFHKVRTTD